MSPLIEMVGKKFGKLTVIERVNGHASKWLCRCDCGNNKVVFGGNLRRGHTQSCGCKKVPTEELRARAIRHGHGAPGKHSLTYASWGSMRERCNNSNASGYENYGGRGIKICERWNIFENFLSDMGERPSPKHTLDRIDPDGNYEPTNCRWATIAEQQRNRRNTQWVEFEGEKVSLGELCEKFGVKYSLVNCRVRRGWPIREALTASRSQGWSRQRRARSYSASGATR
jgi:hypothetical protein